MNKLKSFISNYLDVLAFIIFMTIKFFVYGMQIQEKYFSYKVLFPPVIASIIIIVSFSLLLKRKKRARFLYGANIVLTIIIVADIIYFGYYRDILCIPVIRNGAMLGPVKSSIVSLFKFQYLLFFIDIFILPRIYYKNVIVESRLLKRLATFAIALLIGCSMDGYYIYKLNIDQPRLLTTMFNRIYIAEQLGNLNFHMLDVYNSISQEIGKHKSLSSTKKQEIETFLTNKSTSAVHANLQGTANGKNLIIIQVEALQGFVINNKVEGQEITPNLNKWVQKSSYFDNYFYQVAAGNTSDAEFMTNNSLYPAAEGAACYLYYGNSFNSLPKALETKGYYTAAYHGYREDFWNRSVMNKAEGFNEFDGERSYNLDETVGLGLSDKSFLNQTIDKINKLKQPYFSFLVTLSSHFPFDDVKGYGQFNVGPYENTLLGDYLKGIHYTDAQLGMFMDKLQAEGILDNSIVVIYGDHYAIPQQEQTNLYKLLGINNGSDLTWMELQKVPLLIHFPKDQNAGVNHLYSGEMDLYPTLSNLFDLPNKDELGKDLYNSKEGDVIFRNGSFTDGSTFYLSPSNSYYDISTGGKVQETPDLKSKKESTVSQLEYSDDILNHDLLKK